ncbi:LysR family transcriptional regulator [Pseudomonas sp. CBSPBW29]|jgi:DNA-binding transcriptional LysR family regulator|uniref:LysR family transcriptional regulator n=1 Tax=Pseudomonas TaxID=286 RepID=UPI0002F774DB|nr:MULTISPECIES: LysR family transcriptional regulator [unclassified Pseudomonas]WEL44653.1 LysR family transcriptional regulator [Pseudomonas sp. CBSPBW29]WEL65749.1 LysR family transcriptional regulator [Pseudomonas sp. CBSPGW29]WEL69217.1 LysR family transcriptional regulator [Pseudomonas sp. CBSPCGW29]WEL76208.1 LysR family transcriptional regulator [Pseudomonas sp. CBSPAW29]WEL85216.1 LysR family transcriptional regulator [Pseudomonas sp. CBSPCAW29]WEL88009.1 LysR family transcriptional 
MQYISEIDRLSSYPSIDTEVLRTFVAIADQGGFTRAGEQVNRTQSAVSMQMKRLEEDVLQRKLFERDGRQVRLTPEGQVLLGYARRILKLHSEVFNTLREPHMVGLVRIGTPDDYVMRYLPGILKRFSKAYPLIQIEMHCESSPILMQRRDLALTVISREPGNEMGELLRNERMVWVAAPCFCLDDHSALPLAISGMDSFCTQWTRAALDAIGRDYRLAYHSSNGAAIQAVVGAGLAVTVSMESLVTEDLRVLGSEEGFPPLPSVNLRLLRNPGMTSPITECLAEYILEGFKL